MDILEQIRTKGVAEDADFYLLIVCKNREDMEIMADNIHRQLAGNQDYIDNNILLNYEEEPIIREKEDGTKETSISYRIFVSFFNDAEYPPSLNIDPNFLRQRTKIEQPKKRQTITATRYISHNMKKRTERFLAVDSDVNIPDDIIRNSMIHRRCLATVCRQNLYGKILTTDLVDAKNFRRAIIDQLKNCDSYKNCMIVVTDFIEYSDDSIPSEGKAVISVWYYSENTKFPKGFSMDEQFLKKYVAEHFSKEEENDGDD